MPKFVKVNKMLININYVISVEETIFNFEKCLRILVQHGHYVERYHSKEEGCQELLAAIHSKE